MQAVAYPAPADFTMLIACSSVPVQSTVAMKLSSGLLMTVRHLQEMRRII
jgi:hypothetical protein